METNNLLNIVSKYYSIEENVYLLELFKKCKFTSFFFKRVSNLSKNLIIESRKNINLDNVDNMLGEYNLSNKEGIQMMCLAESLLRIPDFLTTDSFIKDKISFQEWDYYYSSDYWKVIFYNLIIDFIANLYYKNSVFDVKISIRVFKKTVAYFSNYIMKNIGKKFVYSSKVHAAILKSISDKNLYSFDMLGEAAITFYDARKFYNQYKLAIEKIRENYIESKFDKKIPSISIKLSALHPKYNFYNRKKIFKDLIPLIKSLIYYAIKANTEITIDAEESDRMELALGIFNKIYFSPICSKWNGFGLVVQAYSKRALPTLFWLNQIAKIKSRKIPVRLVKGAYWDYEIKLTQTNNYNLYPVYTKKFCTDLSYLLCAIYLLSSKCKNNILPQFATHNIETISFLMLLSNKKNYELQKLFGMGNEVYFTLEQKFFFVYREYAPIGKYKELLPYLVRRLLENGANSSFVNKVICKNINLKNLSKSPFKYLKNKKYVGDLPLPFDMFGGTRQSIYFYNLNISYQNYNFYKKLFLYDEKKWVSSSFLNGKKDFFLCKQPANFYQLIGISKHDLSINSAIRILKKSFLLWKNISIIKKVKIIKNFINLIKEYFIELTILCCKEAGKTILDSIADIREALDFCYYYYNQILLINKNIVLPSTTGETNVYMIEGKGIFSTISPWNFPVAIFCGQTIAALLTGNVVLAKPAESTSLIACKILQLLVKSGLPISVCQIIIGSGVSIGNSISFHNDITGVIFTGSNNVANNISRNLIMRKNRPIYKLIAETGGLNAMIADSTALIEQVVFDVVESAFKSCGQRCSALRLLYLNENIYYDTIKLLMLVLSSLKIGNPIDMAFDLGPIINDKSLKSLKKYIKYNNKNLIFINDKFPKNGYFMSPVLIRVNGIEDLKSEQFGPILHIAMYQNLQLGKIIENINNAEYGLTLGIHSRNEAFYKYLLNKLKVGNIYINRNTIGAIVGMQPFGGCNLSGTGPKAGGANYLSALINEKTITINTTAQGGNVTLLNN